jgi:hypothetical protein
MLVRDSGSASHGGYGEEYGVAGLPNQLEFANVLPGHYRVVLRGFPNVCIGSITSAGSDVERNGLTISPGAAPDPVEVALANDCGSIQLAVNSGGLTNVWVVIVPERPGSDPIEMMGGGFTVSKLRPGSYRVYAFDDISGLEYANPEAMQTFSPKEISIGENQTVQVTLDVIKRNAGNEETASR